MKRLRYIITCCALLLASGCSDWLDVPPSGEIEADKLFETEAGFLSTLTGTYTLLADGAAYGRELTIGFPDEIVRYWNKRSEFYNADYTDSGVVTRLDATWLQMYKAIANVNLMLGYLNKKNPADFQFYDLIRGEALALRGFIHLDLLRLYGPVLKDGLTQLSIPYHMEFDKAIVKRMTAQEVLTHIETDLKEAYVLLANDPIKTYGRKVPKTTTSDAHDFRDLAYNYRGIRMNYYAVCGTLARYYQLIGDKTNALKYAQEVIDAVVGTTTTKIFTLPTSTTVNTNGDWMFQSELLWALYDQKTKTRLDDYLSSVMGWTFNVDKVYKTWVYEDAYAYGTTTDYRTNKYWGDSGTTPSLYMYKRYQRTFNSTGADDTKWDPVVPMIRLSEMYYIAAEAQLETATANSHTLLTAVRTSRGISATSYPLPAALKTDPAGMLDQIVWEYRKDAWGEGELFFLYKRLFRNITTRDATIPASKALFELPLPQDEITHGGN